MKLAELTAETQTMVRAAGLDAAITVERLQLGRAERLCLTRQLGDHMRYLRITDVAERNTGWNFEILGGRYGSADPRADFDARRGGDPTYTKAVIHAWIIELRSWDAVTYVDAPE